MSIFLTYLRQELEKASREASPDISKTLDKLLYLIDLEEQVSNQVDKLEPKVMTVEEKIKELAPYMEKTDDNTSYVTENNNFENIRLILQRIEKLEVACQREPNYINYKTLRERIEKLETNDSAHWDINKSQRERIEKLEHLINKDSGFMLNNSRMEKLEAKTDDIRQNIRNLSDNLLDVTERVSKKLDQHISLDHHIMDGHTERIEFLEEQHKHSCDDLDKTNKRIEKMENWQKDLKRKHEQRTSF